MTMLSDPILFGLLARLPEVHQARIGFGNVAKPDCVQPEERVDTTLSTLPRKQRSGNIAEPSPIKCTALICPWGYMAGSNSKTAFDNIAKSEMGVKNMNKQSHRTCVRMSVKDYELLKKKSAGTGLSANAWLMAQLETNRPFLHREEETWQVIRFMDETGREINEIARDFNSGHGTAEQLRYAVRLLGDVYERIYALRKKGYIRAA